MTPAPDRRALVAWRGFAIATQRIARLGVGRRVVNAQAILVGEDVLYDNGLFFCRGSWGRDVVPGGGKQGGLSGRLRLCFLCFGRLGQESLGASGGGAGEGEVDGLREEAVRGSITCPKMT